MAPVLPHLSTFHTRLFVWLPYQAVSNVGAEAGPSYSLCSPGPVTVPGT